VKTMKSAVVIVNFNKLDLLENCLRSLESSAVDLGDVVVVDNGSSDDSVQWVREVFPAVQVIEMGYNSGFCKANNKGIKKALDQAYDGVVLLNNDTRVEPGSVQKMEQCLNAEKKIGMVAAKILLMNKTDVLDSAGISITPDGLGKNRGHGETRDRYAKQDEVFCPAGAAALYSRQLLEEIEMDGQYLDEDFEFYLEEVDLGWRARLLGWHCAYQPEAVVLHKKRASTDAYPEKMLYLANRNIYYNIIKNYPSFCSAIKAIVLSLLRNVLLLFGSALGKGVVSERQKQVSVSKMLVLYGKGLWEVAKNLKKLLKKRRTIQKSKKISSAETRRIFRELGLKFFCSIYKL